jgi:hypothetical protein
MNEAVFFETAQSNQQRFLSQQPQTHRKLDEISLKLTDTMASLYQANASTLFGGPWNQRLIFAFSGNLCAKVLGSPLVKSLSCADKKHQDWGRAGTAGNRFACDDKEPGPRLGEATTRRKAS